MQSYIKNLLSLVFYTKKVYNINMIIKSKNVAQISLSVSKQKDFELHRER